MHILLLSIVIDLVPLEKEVLTEKLEGTKLFVKIKYDSTEKTVPKNYKLLSGENKEFKKETINRKKKSYQRTKNNNSKTRKKEISLKDLAFNDLNPSKLFKQKVRSTKIKKLQEKQKYTFPDGDFSDLGGDLFQEVKDGKVTQLNSAKMVYFNFFERVKNVLVARWQREISLRDSTLEYLEGTFINSAIIKINQKGEVVDILFNPAIQKEVNQVTLGIFSGDIIFPNPPKKMFNEKPFYYMKYTFILQIR